MNLRLLHAGKAASGPLAQAAEVYRGRLAHHFGAEEILVRPATVGKGGQAISRALEEEGKRLLGRLGPDEVLIALDVRGYPMGSEALARTLQGWMADRVSSVTFALGSAHGLHGSVLSRARARWSFGPPTLPHDLARVVLWEQLYRAGTILRGEPYHK